MPDAIIGIQARIGSSRLPGKVLYKLGKSNMNSIELMIHRIRSCCALKDIPIYLLTSSNPVDKALEFIADQNSLHFRRGEEHDVLSRYSDLAEDVPSTNIIRLTADCPFVSSDEISRLLYIHHFEDFDYTTNTFDGSPTPDGFDVEIFRSESIITSDKLAVLPSEREHVTFHLAKSNLFSVKRSAYPHSPNNIRLTLDTPEDYILICKIIDELPDPLNASSQTILDIYENSNYLRSINSNFEKNHGWLKSFNDDKEYIAKHLKA